MTSGSLFVGRLVRRRGAGLFFSSAGCSRDFSADFPSMSSKMPAPKSDSPSGKAGTLGGAIRSATPTTFDEIDLELRERPAFFGAVAASSETAAIGFAVAAGCFRLAACR